MEIEKLIRNGQFTIIDVRTPSEFEGGNVEGSINIPLFDLPQKIDDIKNINAAILLCCASGNRSRQAQLFLQQQGIECYNAGSWLDVNYLLTEKN